MVVTALGCLAETGLAKEPTQAIAPFQSVGSAFNVAKEIQERYVLKLC